MSTTFLEQEFVNVIKKIASKIFLKFMIDILFFYVDCIVCFLILSKLLKIVITKIEIIN